MNGLKMEVNFYMVDGRLISVTTIYQNGSFLCDHREDVTDQVNDVINQHLVDEKMKI